MQTDPAYFIPLPPDDLQLLGELCAIQGQIEWTMQNTVRSLLDVSTEMAMTLMGSTAMRSNSEIWRRCIAEKCDDQEILRLSALVLKQVEIISAGRNDLVHAVFGSPAHINGGIAFRPNVPNVQPPSGWTAMRVRNRATNGPDRLKDVARTAAAVSIIVAHIFDRVAFPDDTPTWLDKLEPALQLLSPTEQSRKG